MGNTSLGYECDGVGGDCIDIADVRLQASLWTEYIRSLDLEDRVLHVTSAGNIKITGIRDARTNSPFSAAARLSGLTNHIGNPMSNLTNTIVVENAVNRLVTSPPDVLPIIVKCLWKDSFIGGYLAGIGTYVRSFWNASANTEGEDTGTFFSAPQVAGLAAYLLSIDHTLTGE